MTWRKAQSLKQLENKMKIAIKNRYTGLTIFEFEAEKNSMALTVKAAIDSEVNLYNADLTNADLTNADLSNANLYNADLSNADLSHANLFHANLSYSNLSKANLSNVDLGNANLNSVTGNKTELRTMQVDTYSISFTKSVLWIGCKRFTHLEWENFTDDEISKMDAGALDWWKKWKEFVFLAIRLSFN
jgi:hypothetical protein